MTDPFNCDECGCELNNPEDLTTTARVCWDGNEPYLICTQCWADELFVPHLGER